MSAWAYRTRPGLVRLVAIFIQCVALMGVASEAWALKPIAVNGQQDRIDISGSAEIYESRGELQIETAPGPDGAAGRMGVRASTPGTTPNWIAFALHNSSDKSVELWLTTDRFNLVGSGVIWPDLDARRIEAVSHSSGFVPERIKSDRTDIFRLTIERGQTVTYIAELATERFSRIDLWKPLEFEQRARERQLFNGIMLGITGLLAVFLTSVFAANHKAIFPSAALVAWCVLCLLCVDFGFWHKLFQMRPEENAQYRAVSEAAVAASLVIFLFTFLRANLWHGFARMLFMVWIAAQLAIVGTAVLDPKLAATVARMSLGLIGLLGGLIILFFAGRGLDRALALVPTWLLLLVWLFGAAVTLTGQLAGDVAVSGLVAGLVMILVLIGFTVTQFAFRSSEPVYAMNSTQRQLRLTAMEQSAVSVWEWSARRDEIRLDPEIEAGLGLGQGDLPSKMDAFLGYVHAADKERLTATLEKIKEANGGPVHVEIRVRHADSSYRWLEFEGASVNTTDRRALRCVGLVRDITDIKRSQERLMHNAVHDSLTGLPNRELFLDRLHMSQLATPGERPPRSTVILVDLDKFKSINSHFGLIVGDSILLTVARRLSRHLQPKDTLARVGGDQFALLVPGAQDPRELAMTAERMRIALRSPIRIAGQEIVLTGSIGVAIHDGSQAEPIALLHEAEAAARRAKRMGADRIEIFKPEMRVEQDERLAIETGLRKAIEAKQLRVLYQPIIALSNEELVGFEALIRWDHPRLGQLSPSEFVPVAEESDLINKLGSFVLNRATTDIARWQADLPRPEQPLFVAVNVSSRQLISPEIVQEIRHILGRAVLPAGSLKLEITESLVMENPEQATQVLDLLKEAGVGLAMDDFGTGYSSLAYLSRFPFDTIKLDKALVHANSEGESGAVIVKSIVAMAHELGKKLVAEGIETPEDASFMRSLGCQYGQGFYYGEPMGENDVARLLRLIRKADRRMRRRGLVRGTEKKKGPEGPDGSELMPESMAEALATQAATQPPSRPSPMASATSQRPADVTRPSQTQSPPSQPVPPSPMGQRPPVTAPSQPRPGMTASPSNGVMQPQPQTRPQVQPPSASSAPPAASAPMSPPPRMAAPPPSPPISPLPHTVPPPSAAQPQTQVPPRAAPTPRPAADPARTAPAAAQRPLRNPNGDGLSPGVAASLARLAAGIGGKRTPESGPDGSGGPGQDTSKKSAAE